VVGALAAAPGLHAWFVPARLDTSALWSTAASLACGQASLGPLLMLHEAGAAFSVAWMQQPVQGWFRPAAPSPFAARVGRTVGQAKVNDAAFLVVLLLCRRLLEDEAGPPRWREGASWP
jgi:hypothetical protein